MISALFISILTVGCLFVEYEFDCGPPKMYRTISKDNLTLYQKQIGLAGCVNTAKDDEQIFFIGCLKEEDNECYNAVKDNVQEGCTCNKNLKDSKVTDIDGTNTVCSSVGPDKMDLLKCLIEFSEPEFKITAIQNCQKKFKEMFPKN